MLVLARKVGEKIIIGNSIVVEVLKSQGGRVRLGVDAPREVCIFRDEIRDRFRERSDSNQLKTRPNRSRFFPEFA